MKKIILILMVFVFMITMNVFAKKETNGKVVALKGKVYILEYQKGYKKQRLYPNKYIHPLDIILTTKTGVVKVKLADGSHIVVKQNSRIKFSFVSNKSQRIRVSQGGVLSKVSRLTTRKGFSVTTPNGVAGVRGTKFIVEYDENDKSNRVDVYEGKVDNDQISVSREKKNSTIAGVVRFGHERRYNKSYQALPRGKAYSAHKGSGSARGVDSNLLDKYESLIDEKELSVNGWEFN